MLLWVLPLPICTASAIAWIVQGLYLQRHLVRMRLLECHDCLCPESAPQRGPAIQCNCLWQIRPRPSDFWMLPLQVLGCIRFVGNEWSIICCEECLPSICRRLYLQRCSAGHRSAITEQIESIVLDQITFMCNITACGHIGLFAEGIENFTAESKKWHITFHQSMTWIIHILGMWGMLN